MVTMQSPAAVKLLLQRLRTQSHSLNTLRHRQTITRNQELLRQSTGLGVITGVLATTSVPAAATDFLWQEEISSTEENLDLLPQTPTPLELPFAETVEPAESIETAGTAEPAESDTSLSSGDAVHLNDIVSGSDPAPQESPAVSGNPANTQSFNAPTQRKESLQPAHPIVKPRASNTAVAPAGSVQEYDLSAPQPYSETPAPAGHTASGQEDTTGTSLQKSGEYTVVKGDTLWDIAASVLQERDAFTALTSSSEQEAAIAAYWNQIYQINQESIGSDPDLIHSGLCLVLPEV